MESYIGKALEELRCVVAVWYHASINSDWVKEEADEAKEKGLLVPIFLDAIVAPRGFRRIQAADLSDWNNNTSHKAFQEFVNDITSIISSSIPPVASKSTIESDIVPTSIPPNLKIEMQQNDAANESWFSIIKPKQAVVVVAVVMAAILLVIWLTGRKQENMPQGKAPIALSTSASPYPAAERAKPMDNDSLLPRAEEAKLKIKPEAEVL